jgi:hypothetical protein
MYTIITLAKLNHYILIIDIYISFGGKVGGHMRTILKLRIVDFCPDLQTKKLI